MLALHNVCVFLPKITSLSFNLVFILQRIFVHEKSRAKTFIVMRIASRQIMRCKTMIHKNIHLNVHSIKHGKTMENFEYNIDVVLKKMWIYMKYVMGYT